MFVKAEKNGFCGNPTIQIACIHTMMRKGGLWGMSLSTAKQLHRKLGRIIEKADKTSLAKKSRTTVKSRKQAADNTAER